MVAVDLLADIGELLLSVLALSSRFDGREPAPTFAQPDSSFSTRSVESF